MEKRRMRKMISILGLIAFAACDPAEDLLITDVTLEPVDSWQFSLAGLAPTPQAGGTINITQYVSHFIADASFTGLGAASTYQWRTFFGTCAQRIGAFGPNANPPAYQPIETNGSGAGSAKASVVGRLKADSSYHIRVYTFTTVAPIDTTWYACGDIPN